MAKKPQYNVNDLLRYVESMLGGPKTPVSAPAATAQSINRAKADITTKYVSPQYFGEKGNVPTALYDYLTPAGVLQSGEELKRGATQGVDRGNVMSVLIGLGLFGANRAFKGARGAYKTTKQVYRDNQAPVGSRTQPKRTATTSMTSNTADPMVQYGVYNALTNRR